MIDDPKPGVRRFRDAFICTRENELERFIDQRVSVLETEELYRQHESGGMHGFR